MKKVLWASVALVAALALTSCEKKVSDAKSAEEAVEIIADDVENAVEDAAHETEQALEKAGEEIEKAVN